MGRRRSENLLSGAGSYARAVQAQQRAADSGDDDTEWFPRSEGGQSEASAEFERNGRVPRKNE